jgi:hypothetical protein
LEDVVEPKLIEATRSFAEARAPGNACVVRPLGRDTKYLFMAIGCAVFAEVEGKIHLVTGDSTLQPTRLRFSGDQVSSWEQPDSRARENSLWRAQARIPPGRYGQDETANHSELLGISG